MTGGKLGSDPSIILAPNSRRRCESAARALPGLPIVQNHADYWGVGVGHVHQPLHLEGKVVIQLLREGCEPQSLPNCPRDCR